MNPLSARFLQTRRRRGDGRRKVKGIQKTGDWITYYRHNMGDLWVAMLPESLEWGGRTWKANS